MLPPVGAKTLEQERSGVTGPPEPILALANAGCSVRFYRSSLAGGCRFHAEVAMGRVVNEDMDIEWDNHPGEPVGSFEELAPIIAGWLILSPVEVHPDYRAAVWRVVRDTINGLTADRQQAVAWRLDLWQRACHPHAG